MPGVTATRKRWRGPNGKILRAPSGKRYVCEECPCGGAGCVQCLGCCIPATIYVSLNSSGIGCPCANGTTVTLTYNAGAGRWEGSANVCGCMLYFRYTCEVTGSEFPGDNDNMEVSYYSDFSTSSEFSIARPTCVSESPVWVVSPYTFAFSFSSAFTLGDAGHGTCPGCSGFDILNATIHV